MKKQSQSTRFLKIALAMRRAKLAGESLARAEMVLNGNHPTIDYDTVRGFYGLDRSFQYTPELLAPYTDAYAAELSN